LKNFRFLLFGLILFVALASLSFAQEIWYEDNNLGKAGAVPSDFFYKFENPTSWQQVRNNLNVYMLRANILDLPEMNESFLENRLKPLTEKDGIKIAIDSSGVTWSGCKDRSKSINTELDAMARMRRMGLQVHYLSLQSLISKPFRTEGKTKDDEVACPLDNRVRGGVEYVKKFKAIYPEAVVGIIDALPSHGDPYKEAYKYATDVFRASGVPLGYIHLDVTAEMIRKGVHGLSWPKILEVESYVKRLGLKFGLIFTSRMFGNKSDEAFFKAVLEELEDYLQAGGKADHYIIASWFPYPKQSVRRAQDPPGGYPITDAVVEFSTRLKTPPAKEKIRRKQ
jgi:hypothetical protein